MVNDFIFVWIEKMLTDATRRSYALPPQTSKIEGGNVGAESGSEIRVFSPMNTSDLIWNFRSELDYDSDIRPITSRVIENHNKSPPHAAG